MACGCGRSEDGCRGWHSLTEEEYKVEYEAFLKEKEGSLRVLSVHHFTDTLFSFQLSKPKDYTFKAGQFTMLNVDGAPKRAYSYTSGPDDNFLEFYSIKVPNGALTSKLKEIKKGDFVNVSNKASGTLLIDNLTQGDNLWLLATGTGIAPFISMLSDDKTFETYKEINVLWSVREEKELASFDYWLSSLGINYTPIVTRDDQWEGENRRITSLISQRIAMKDTTPDNDKVMVCGNMDFNKDIKTILDSRGWEEGSNREKGSYVLEKAFVS